MDVMEAIETRRSIRRYQDRPVPKDALDKVLEAARIAPSASNVQSWKFKVVTDTETRKRIRVLAMGQRFVEEAPAVIACCLDLEAYAERGKRARELVFKGKVRPSMEMILRSVRGNKDGDFDPERMVINGVINVSIAVENMVLAATALGLGTCWVRAFDAPAVERLLDIPEGVSVLVLLTLGYPNESPVARPRKSLDEILV
jgi:nitroreductase